MPEGLWAFATIAGPVLLAIVFVYGIIRWRKRTPQDIERTERATRENYGKVEKR
jgi:hypothetical protein